MYISQNLELIMISTDMTNLGNFNSFKLSQWYNSLYIWSILIDLIKVHSLIFVWFWFMYWFSLYFISIKEFGMVMVLYRSKQYLKIVEIWRFIYVCYTFSDDFDHLSKLILSFITNICAFYKSLHRYLS